jgi:hypothetical protein
MPKVKPNLGQIGRQLLDEHKTSLAAAEALAKQIAADGDLRLALALDFIKRFEAKPKKETASRRRVGPHRSNHGRRSGGVPTTAQKVGAVRAQKLYAETIFDRKLRGGRKLGDVHVHELRAIAESSALTAVSFLQRGYDDAVEVFACTMLTKHCVASDPFAKVRDVIKASIATSIFDKAKIKAAEMLRDGGAKIARELIAAAQQQELSPP